MTQPLPGTIKGNGAPVELTARDLTLLLQEADHLKNDAASALVSRARDAGAARWCTWAGQSADGRKWAANEAGQVLPYKGAPDSRIRLVDFLVTFRTALCLAAASDSSRTVAPMEITDAGFSGRMQTLLNWVLENQLGDTLHAELSRLLSWIEGDSPGAAVMGVYWRRDTGVDVTTITAQELVAALLVEDETTDPALLAGIIADPTGAPVVAMALRSLFPALSPKEAKAAASDLRNTGTATFPSPVTRYDGVVLCAHRLWDTIFIPANTLKDIQRAPVIFIRESLSEVELRERVTTAGYSPAFADEMCGTLDDRGNRRGGHIGQSWIDDSYKNASVELAKSGLRITRGERNRGMIEVLTAYYRAIGDNGHAGIYCVPFSPLAKMAAKPRELCGYHHGKYPFVYFAAEHNNDDILDTRSTAEKNYTDQTAMKKLADSSIAHAELTALPPMEINTTVVDDQTPTNLQPFAQNPVRSAASGRRFMELPGKSSVAMEMMDRIDARVAMYNGIPHPQVPDTVTQVVQRQLVTKFLTSYREVLVMILQLCQQYMTPEQLATVTGARPDQQAIPTPESIRKRFNLRVSFDPRVLNREYLVELMDFATKIVSLDTKGTVMRDRLVALVTRALDPALADYALQPVEQADQQEVDTVKADFAKMVSGVMPDMPEQGVNYDLRMQTLQQIQAANPILDAPGRLTPDSTQMIRQYTDWLKQGIEQEFNKVRGRLGTSPELDVEAALRNSGQPQEVAP